MRRILILLAVPLAGCSVDPSLTCGTSCGGGPADVNVADAPVDSPVMDATTGDATVDAPADVKADAPVDAPADVKADAPVDAGCSVTCPSGSTCNGSFCSVPQGTACGSAVSTAGASGALDGVVCAGTGPTITTTCTSPITASASFLKFTSGGDPWNVTVTAVDGPLQIEVLNGSCSTGSACYTLASGASTVILVNQNTVIAIVNGTGSTCTSWQITYISK